MNYNTELSEKYAIRFLKENGCEFPTRLWNYYMQFYKRKVIKGKKERSDQLSIKTLSAFVYLARMETKFPGFSKLLSYDKKHKSPFGMKIPDGIKDYGVLLTHSPKQVTRYLRAELRFINVKGYEYLKVQKKKQDGESDEDYNKRIMKVCLKRVDEYINKQRYVRKAKLEKALKFSDDLITVVVYQSLLKNHRTGKNTEAQIKKMKNILVKLEQWSYDALRLCDHRLINLEEDRKTKEKKSKERKKLQELKTK